MTDMQKGQKGRNFKISLRDVRGFCSTKVDIALRK